MKEIIFVGTGGVTTSPTFELESVEMLQFNQFKLIYIGLCNIWINDY